MDKQEAIKWLKAIEEKYIRGGDEDYDAKRKEAIAIAIETLKQGKGEQDGNEKSNKDI